MTNKELTYVEDALNQVKHLRWLCDECATSISNPELKSFVREVQNEIDGIYNNLFNTLKR